MAGSSAATCVIGSRRFATPRSVGSSAATDSIGPRSRSTPCSAGTSAPVPRVESPIASVLRRIVSELLLIASVFCRTVVATEQPAVIAAATTIAGMCLISISPQSRSAKAFALPPQSRSAESLALPPQSRSAESLALPRSRSRATSVSISRYFGLDPAPVARAFQASVASRFASAMMTSAAFSPIM